MSNVETPLVDLKPEKELVKLFIKGRFVANYYPASFSEAQLQSIKEMITESFHLGHYEGFERRQNLKG